MNVEQAIDRSSWKQWAAALAAASLMFNINFLDVIWIHPTDTSVTTTYGFFSNVGFVVIGAFLGAILADQFGRRITLLGATIFIIPRLICAIFFMNDWIWVVKIFTDLGSGITCTVIPLYISEISDANNRNRLLTLQLLVISFGTVIITAIQSAFPKYEFLGAMKISNGILITLTGLFHFIILLLFPESPYYLISKKKYQEAAHSLAFFRGMSCVQIREEAIELSHATLGAIKKRQDCLGKIREMFQFDNRRSLAIIFSLIAIRWAAGQRPNFYILFLSTLYFRESTYLASLVISVIQLILSGLITLAIGTFESKLSILSVIFLSFISAILGMIGLTESLWALLGIFIVQNICYLIIIGVTLAYTGKFFPTNIRALAIATVMSFEILIRNSCSVFQYLTAGQPDRDDAQWYSFVHGGVYLSALIFIIIFFPKINKIPCSRIAITSAEGQGYLS